MNWKELKTVPKTLSNKQNSHLDSLYFIQTFGEQIITKTNIKILLNYNLSIFLTKIMPLKTGNYQ